MVRRLLLAPGFLHNALEMDLSGLEWPIDIVSNTLRTQLTGSRRNRHDPGTLGPLSNAGNTKKSSPASHHFFRAFPFHIFPRTEKTENSTIV